MNKLSKNILQENITQQNIENTTLFYILVDKKNKTLSSKNRIIILDKTADELLYVPEDTVVKFINQANFQAGRKIKKDEILKATELDIKRSLNQVTVKGKLISNSSPSEWNLIFTKTKIASQWCQMMFKYKEEKEEQKKLANKNNEVVQNNFVLNNQSNEKKNHNQQFYPQNQSGYQENNYNNQSGYRQNNFKDNNQSGYKDHNQSGYRENNQSGFKDNNQSGYKDNNQSGYNQSGYKDHNQSGYQNNNQSGYRDNDPNSQKDYIQSSYQAHDQSGYRQKNYNNNKSQYNQNNQSAYFEKSRNGNINQSKYNDEDYYTGNYEKTQNKNSLRQEQRNITLSFIHDSKVLLTNPDVSKKLRSPTQINTHNKLSESHFLQMSRNKPENQYQVRNDWNYKFLQKPTLATISNFQNEATQVGLSFISKYEKEEYENLQVFERDNFTIAIAELFTPEAKNLKKQFRNYPYIMETSCNTIIGVPLSTLIEYNDLVALVKAKLPTDQFIKNIKDVEYLIYPLEEKTKILTNIFLKENYKIVDVTKFYGSNGEYPLLYLDNLTNYMPELKLSRKKTESFLVRPQLLMELLHNKVPGGNLEQGKQFKLQTDILKILNQEVKQIGDYLSSEDIYITNIADLKQLLHFRGINMKVLPQLIAETNNKFVKKYVHTCLAAKLVKDSINAVVRCVGSSKLTQQEKVQAQIKNFIEGKNVQSNETWKRLSLEFRNLYGISISTHDLEGGFFLNCILTLLPIDFDIAYLDKSKRIFQDTKIIGRGFVRKLNPKVKSFYRFNKEIMQTCKYSKKNEKQFQRIVDQLELKKNQIPPQYSINDEKKYILAYLSDFIPPVSIQSNQDYPCASEIYSYVNHQPPSTATIKITLNYLQFLLNQKDSKQRKKNLEQQIQNAIDIMNYWLGNEHPQICDFYDRLGGFKVQTGQVEEGIDIFQRSRQIAEKTQAKNPQKLGARYYILGSQYLRCGVKKEALKNLEKAKACLEKNQQKQHEYALILMKLSSLYLNGGKIKQSIDMANQAMKAGQSSKLHDRYQVKIYQILCRGYQINEKKEELKNLALKCAKRFQATQQRFVLSEVVKISLTAVFAKLSLSKAKNAVKIGEYLRKKGKIKDEVTSIKQLMLLLKSKPLLFERFLSKAEFKQTESSQPIPVQFNEYIDLYSLLIGSVTMDFIEGLQDQKQFE